MTHCAYLFLDESGNLDFSDRGTRYFVLTSVSMVRPFRMYDALDAYKYDCLNTVWKMSISIVPRITGMYGAGCSTSFVDTLTPYPSIV